MNTCMQGMLAVAETSLLQELDRIIPAWNESMYIVISIV